MFPLLRLLLIGQQAQLTVPIGVRQPAGCIGVTAGCGAFQPLHRRRVVPIDALPLSVG